MRRFAYRLAAHTGRVNVDAMLDEMTATQLREWMVFNSLEPFWEERMGDLFGSVTQVLMNVHRDKSKRRSPFKLNESRLFFGDESKKAPTDWKLVALQMQFMATVMQMRAEKAAKREEPDV